jgi:hypothetical protein
VTLCERRRLRADEVIHEGHDFAATQNVCLWPIVTNRILVADRRFRGITDMAGAAAGRTQTRMTRSGHQGQGDGQVTVSSQRCASSGTFWPTTGQ